MNADILNREALGNLHYSAHRKLESGIFMSLKHKTEKADLSVGKDPQRYVTEGPATKYLGYNQSPCIEGP